MLKAGRRVLSPTHNPLEPYHEPKAKVSAAAITEEGKRGAPPGQSSATPQKASRIQLRQSPSWVPSFSSIPPSTSHTWILIPAFEFPILTSDVCFCYTQKPGSVSEALSLSADRQARGWSGGQACEQEFCPRPTLQHEKLSVSLAQHHLCQARLAPDSNSQNQPQPQTQPRR